jgi:ABC-type multidrug transport system fused ATPase/permease subunit
MAGILALSFAQSYSFSMLPTYSTNFLFELITPEKIHLIYKYFAIAVGLIVLKTLFAFFTNYATAIVSASAIKSIRDDLFGHMIALDHGFYSEHKTGDLISIGINDVEEIKTWFYQQFISFLGAVIMAVIIVVKLFLLNWTFTLISLGLMPVLYIVGRIIGTKMRAVGRELRKSIARISSNFHESFTGIDVIKSFSTEEHERSGFRENTERYKKHYLGLARLNNFLGPLNEMLIYLFAMALVGIGSVFIIRGDWNVKLLTEYLMLLGIMSAPLKQIPIFITKFKIVTASVDRIQAVLSTKPKVVEPEKPVERKIDGSIEFKDVWFAYKQPDFVLRGVSFRAQKGEIVALVGPSGAGKTTIANLIPRFYDPDQGRVLIDGIDVRDFRLKSLRTQVGVVSQNVSLFNTSILENIRYAKRDAPDTEIIEAAKRAYAHDFIADLPKGYDTNIGERGVKLSGGQKQRIIIARTILMNPEILILDEATSSLDSESEYYIQLAINELMEGRTSVIIAHRLSTVNHATKILVIDNGKLIDSGTHDDLMERCPQYSKIYDLQYFR